MGSARQLAQPSGTRSKRTSYLMFVGEADPADEKLTATETGAEDGT